MPGTLPGWSELACRRLSTSWRRCWLTLSPFICSMEDWVREDRVLWVDCTATSAPAVIASCRVEICAVAAFCRGSRTSLSLCPTTPALPLLRAAPGTHSATVQAVCAVRLHGTTCMLEAGSGTAAALFKAAWPSQDAQGSMRVAADIARCNSPCRTAYLWEGLVEAEVAAMCFVDNEGHLPSMAHLSYACSRHVWLLANMYGR